MFMDSSEDRDVRNNMILDKKLIRETYGVMGLQRTLNYMDSFTISKTREKKN